MRALGNVMGSGGQYDVGDGIFRPGGWGGGIFDSNLSGLGADEMYPWHAYADATKQFQTTVNDALRAQGYCPIEADGKLGAATCGASKALIGQYPPTCQSFTPPSRGPCGGSTPSPAYVAPAPSTLPATTAAPQAYQMSMWSSGSWKKYAAFAVGALAVGGIAYYLTTHKKGS